MSLQNAEEIVVFVHGFLGFNTVPLPWRPLHYFRHARECLQERGLESGFPSVPAAGSIEMRAAVLSEYLARLPARRIHLIGHSMGGLDSRYVACMLDPEHRIHSVVTIGTPHRGSPVASWFFATQGLLQWLGRAWAKAALRDLTPEACSEFNDRIGDRPDVRYLSFTGVRPVAELPFILRPWGKVLQKEYGDNDGLVPASSAIWGETGGALRSDHLELVGWSLARRSAAQGRPFDDRSLYRRILDLLEAG